MISEVLSKGRTAIKDPYKAKIKLGRLSCGLKRHFPHDIGVHGSYYTGNIGDRAIGHIIGRELTKRGYRTFLYSRQSRPGNSSVNILGGGGVLHDWQGTDALQNRLSFLSEGDVVLGIGAPGLLTEKACKIVRDRLPELGLVTVRDERSKRVLQEVCNINVHITACPAWLHSDPGAEGQSRTGVNFRPWFNLPEAHLTNYFGYDKGIDADYAKQRYIENAQRICDALDDPIFIPFKEKDVMFARKHLDVEIFKYDFSVEKTLKRVSSVN